MKKFFESITSTPSKAISFVIISIFIIVILILLLKKGSKAITSAINDVKVSTRNDLTYSGIEYDQMAKKIQEAISGWGTDENAIYSVFRKIKSVGDYYALCNSYTSIEGDLTEDLYGDLSTSEIEEINNILLNNSVEIQL